MVSSSSLVSIATLLVVAQFYNFAEGIQQDGQQVTTNTTTTTRKLFAYAGQFLPSDWLVVSILDNRAVIGFTNGSARNALLDDLETKDKVFLQKLQNGTIYSTPLSSAKEKIAQWSSSVSTTVSKFGKSVKDQLDSFINNKPKEQMSANSTVETIIL